jgi:F0F1-type ATP synthase membrane subunit c/vacuolar-type H+-ATPase subunit K
MPASQATGHGKSAVKLALLVALTAGLALGYLGHRYREALVSNAGTIGLAIVILIAAVAVVGMIVRLLTRANSRAEAIFDDELRDRGEQRKS